MKLFERKCPVCTEDKPFRIFSDSNFNIEALDSYSFSSRKLPEYMHFRLLECIDCSCIFASPAPSMEELETLYNSAAFDSVKESAYAAKTYATSVFANCGRSNIGLSPNSKVLDIGAGDGSFLLELYKRGMHNLTGIEPSIAPINKASPEIRQYIRNEMFDPDNFPSERFDLVTVFQTIEHLENPRELIAGIFRLLNPGGKIMIVCHNFDSLSRKILGKKSPIFDVEHLQLFRPSSISTLLTLTGFEKVTAQGLWNKYPISYWLKLMPLPIQLKKIILSLTNGTIGSIPLTVPAGNLLAIGSKPF